jgi:hypothetical protein
MFVPGALSRPEHSYAHRALGGRYRQTVLNGAEDIQLCSTCAKISAARDCMQARRTLISLTRCMTPLPRQACPQKRSACPAWTALPWFGFQYCGITAQTTRSWQPSADTAAVVANGRVYSATVPGAATGLLGICAVFEKVEDLSKWAEQYLQDLHTAITEVKCSMPLSIMSVHVFAIVSHRMSLWLCLRGILAVPCTTVQCQDSARTVWLAFSALDSTQMLGCRSIEPLASSQMHASRRSRPLSSLL